MLKTLKSLSKLQKFLIILGVSFFATTLRVCADEISTAQAKVYRENFITEAKKYVGCPYVYGAVGPNSFDCSGLIYYTAHKANGMQLPRTAKALYAYAKIVSDDKREPGDLVFFKTTSSGTISHVGIYIGNGQFISAVSDGPNTGVILSSLNEAYWKPRYMGAGQIIKSGKMTETSDSYSPSKTASAKPKTSASAKSTAAKKSDNKFVAPTVTAGSSFHRSGDSLFESLVFDQSITCAWSLHKANSFMINFRGIDLQTDARVSKWLLEPGLGFSLRYNAGLEVFQIPVTANLTINDYIKVFAGPIFTFGNAVLPGSSEREEIKPSILPGMIGISFTTPSFTKGNLQVQMVQDIRYSICNRPDGAALSFADSITSGLELFTGVRVSLSPKLFAKK